jgi:hypothetical protein
MANARALLVIAAALNLSSACHAATPTPPVTKTNRPVLYNLEGFVRLTACVSTFAVLDCHLRANRNGDAPVLRNMPGYQDGSLILCC